MILNPPTITSLRYKLPPRIAKKAHECTMKILSQDIIKLDIKGYSAYYDANSMSTLSFKSYKNKMSDITLRLPNDNSNKFGSIHSHSIFSRVITVIPIN